MILAFHKLLIFIIGKFNPVKLISKLLIFINFKNFRTIMKINRLRNFPGLQYHGVICTGPNIKQGVLDFN